MRCEHKELREDYIRIKRSQDAVVILAGVISWDGPATPILEWKVVRRLPADTGPEKIEKAVAAVLKDPEFFLVCTECGERLPVGHMFTDEICQSCATRKYGVVY